MDHVVKEQNNIYSFINRRWVEENGRYPTTEECASIVQMVGIMNEFWMLFGTGRCQLGERFRDVG